MSKGEIQFIVSFVAGMAFFWLSSKASTFVPVMNSQLLAETLGIVISAVVYGFGIAILTTITLGAKRSFKAIIVATVIAMVLAELTAQLLVRLVAGSIHNTTQLTLFMFVMYLLFGLYYVACNFVAQRLAK
ncbi:MAG TPA: hypothetical protein VGH44_02780 [Candidatus Saccharimonadia bacterium]|jgi:uncharacterized membrane protein